MSDEELPRDLALLADEALQGLCPNEWTELDRLRPPSSAREAEITELELAAAHIAVLEAVPEPLPEALAARLMAASQAAVIGRVVPEAKVVALEARPRLDPMRYSGWLLAAAIALGFWLAWPGAPALPKDTTAQRPPAVAPIPPPAAAPSIAEERQTFLAKSGVRRVPWVPTTDTAGVGTTGDVVWSAHEQKGFMHFHGLAHNDPRQLQYQLWIFDSQRDQKHPVDGGVFDVGSEGDVIVAIDPRVPVHDATLFAITIEPPGGVVVSKRERIVVTAALPPT